MYTAHTTQLSCVAVSIDRILAASVERCDRPRIHIWDVSSCRELIILPLLHRKGVASIQFSSDRKLLLSVGLDVDHSIALWHSPTSNWLDGSLLACGRGDPQPVVFASFYSISSIIFASGGIAHVKFWNLHGKCLNSNFAEYPHKVKLGYVICGAQLSNYFITGSATGHLVVWRGRIFDRIIKAHESEISVIWTESGKSSLGMLTAGKDGVIHQWSEKIEHVKSFSMMEADISPILKGVHSLDVSLNSTQDSVMKIAALTYSAETYEVAAKSGNVILLCESHYTGELWGLAVHPTKADLFATAGDDKTVRVWSVGLRRLIKKAVLDSTARCLNWSPDGSLLIIGLGGSVDGTRQRKDGAYLLLDGETLKPLFEGRDSRHWIRDVKFSPDGRSYAVASMDHKIYIYHLDSYRLRGSCEKHNSYIRSFDFSEDGKFIQSDSGDYEHLYFEAADGSHHSVGSNLRDMEWLEWTCCYGWPVLGIWPRQELSDIGIASATTVEPTCVYRSLSKKYIAVGFANGEVRVYNFPCVSKETLYIRRDAHVGEVAKVRLSIDEKYIISIGKSDKAIIIWDVFGLDK